MAMIRRSSFRALLNHQWPWNQIRKLLHSQAMSSQQSQSQSQSLYRKQISVANLLQRYGFPNYQLSDFLCKNCSVVDSDLKAMENSLRILLLDFKIPQKDLASLVLDCPGVLDLDFLRNWESRFSELNLATGSPLVIKSLLEHSRKFSFDSDGLSRATEVFKGLGFGEKTLNKVLEGFPGVTFMDESEILKRIKFLSEIRIHKEGVERIIRSVPVLLGFGVENRLKPLISEFKGLGFSVNLIRNEIVREPSYLAMEVGELSRCLDFLRSLNCRHNIKMEILYNGEFRACFKVKLRVDYFCKLGLTRREAFGVLRKEPRVLIYSIEDLEKKVDFMVNMMRYDIRWLIEVPHYLGVSFQKQIVSRFNVIEYLRSIGGLGFEIGLSDMIKPSRLEFYNLYVKPYPECEKMYPRRLGDIVVEKPYPEGMWKSFKPKKYEPTREDIENMKSFMKSIAK